MVATPVTTHAVVAHTARREMAEALAEETGARIFYDDGRAGEQANHARALAWLAAQPTAWVTLLEDDALPCPDYLTVEADGLARAPRRHIVSQYLGTGRWAGAHPEHHAPRVAALIAHADARGDAWIKAAPLWHAVGVSMPRGAAKSALPHLGRRPTDQALTRWAILTGWHVAYTWPSWVDHADTPTVTVHPDGRPRTEPRRAWRVAGADTSVGAR